MSNQMTTPENMNQNINQNINQSRKHSGSEKSSSKRIGRTILSCIFSFMVAISLFVFSTVCTVRIVLSESFLESCITDSYYTGVKEDVETDAWDYTIPTGIDPSVTEGLFNEAMIRLDLESYISSTFKIRQYTINTSSQEEVLREKVMAFLETEGTPTETVNPADSEVELDEESVNTYNEAVEATKSAVDDYVNDIMDIYLVRYFKRILLHEGSQTPAQRLKISGICIQRRIPNDLPGAVCRIFKRILQPSEHNAGILQGIHSGLCEGDTGALYGNLPGLALDRDYSRSGGNAASEEEAQIS